MKPLPWSHSSLDDFANCPHAYHEKRIAKRFKEEKSEQMIWGERVHKAFEDRIAHGVVLPQEVAVHEFYMKILEAMPGEKTTERKVALRRDLKPCGFFDEGVWFRGIIDFTVVHGNSARIIDYKTGRAHNKFQQLQLFALHTFAQYPQVDTVMGLFYWTTINSTTQETYTRDQVPAMWSKFIPGLKQYAEAFKTDVWQKRQSGLCSGWCSVTDCEFWKPRRTT